METSRSIIAETRELFGTGHSRALRRAGKVPASIYGGDNNSHILISLPQKELDKYYTSPGFTSTVIEVKLDKTTYHAVPYEFQTHHIQDKLIHLDLMLLGKKSRKVKVPILYSNRLHSIGVKKGGTLNIVKRYLDLNCTLGNVPKNITIDLSKLGIGQSIKSDSITLPKGVEFFDKSKILVLASISGRAKATDTTSETQKSDTE